MLQTACMSPELLVNQNMSESEICGYSPGLGSPLPGETASPKSCFQQSPSLPDSGLTELNVASPKLYHPPPACRAQGMPAPADSELSSDPPQKRYMGVRVKMPVRELLRKIRLSQGVEPARSKESSAAKMVTKGSSGKTAEKRRAHPYTEKQLRQSKQSAGQSPRGLEDLDILVEVLQEDLKRSQRREQPPLGQGSPREPRSCQGELGGLRGGQDRSSDRCPKDFHPILRGAQPSFSDCCPKDFHPKDFHPIPRGGQSSSSDCCPKDFHPKDFHPKDFHPKDFHPILRWAQPSSSDSCPKDFHPKDFHTKDFHTKDFHPILRGGQPSSAELLSESCFKNFHPILSGEPSSSSDCCPKDFHPKDFHPKDFHPKDFHPKDFHPILREGQPNSSDSCFKDFHPKEFHPILQGGQPSSSDCCPKNFHPKDFHPKDFHPKDFHPILQGGQPNPAELLSDPCFKDFHAKDFHPILRREQPSSSDSCPKDFHPKDFRPKDFHPVLCGGQPSSAELLSDSCFKDFHPKDFHPKDFHPKDFHPKDFPPIPWGQAENPFRGEGFIPPGMFSRNGWCVQDELSGSLKDFPRNSPPQNIPAPLGPAEMLLGTRRGSPRPGEQPSPISFTGQDLSALSFFQFQLHREENLLRNIPQEKLLAPDENGNRLLHKAVAQGKRALTFALAQKFASLDKIDEKDAEERTALHLAAEKNQHLMVNDLISLGANVNEQDRAGKTPLHLCAEKGYLRVLEVLKNCKTNGVCVEVDLPDRHGLTPLHRAALAHTVLVAKSQRTALDSDLGRLLSLRRSQILEGIQCLLQMGAENRLEVLNSCQSSSTRLKLEENTELMGLLQTHKPQALDVLQESCSLMDAPRGIPTPPAAQNFPGPCPMAPSDLFDVLLEGKC